jgi:hypothetical protein
MASYEHGKGSSGLTDQFMKFLTNIATTGFSRKSHLYGLFFKRIILRRSRYLNCKASKCNMIDGGRIGKGFEGIGRGLIKVLALA